MKNPKIIINAGIAAVALTVLPGCVLYAGQINCLIVLFSYHGDDTNSKQDFPLLCHFLSYPFCLDRPYQLRYFSIRFIRN